MKKTTSDNQVNSLLTEILKIPGKKIITLAFSGGTFAIDISKTGEFGYEISHKLLFICKLHRAFTEGGGLIIREFLPIKTKRIVPNGKEMWIPQKNLYGVIMRGGEWFGLDAEAAKESYNTDNKTGLPLQHEPDVYFKSFPLEG